MQQPKHLRFAQRPHGRRPSDLVGMFHATVMALALLLVVLVGPSVEATGASSRSGDGDAGEATALLTAMRHALGTDAAAERTNLRLVGSLHLPALDRRARTTTLLRRGDQIRMEIEAEGASFVQLFDGMSGWMLGPTPDGGIQAQPAAPDDALLLATEALIESFLLGWSDAAVTRIGLAGDVKEAEPSLVLHLANGAEVSIVVDTETSLPRMRRVLLPNGGRYRRTFEDYRSVDGVQIAGTVTSERDGMRQVRTVEEAAWDVAVDEALFRAEAKGDATGDSEHVDRAGGGRPDDEAAEGDERAAVTTASGV